MQKLRLAAALGWGFPTWQEDDEARLLASFDIRHVQVFRNREKDIDPAEVRRRLADHGIQVTSFHAAFGNQFDPSHPDESLRRSSVENLAREMDFCLDLGGSLVVVHPGDADIGDQARDPKRIAALASSAEELAGLGQARKVVVALENLQPGQMGDDMAMLRRIVDEVNSPHLGINYDCGHANLTADPLTVLQQAGSRIVSTHIHDNSGADDEHLAPGFGRIDMDAVCRGLATVGYRGEFVLELMETTDALRQKCDAAWAERLNHWIDLASGITP